MVKLVEICEAPNSSNVSRAKYSLREIYINPKHVVSLRGEPKYKQKLQEGVLPENLDLRQEFTRVVLDKGSVGLEVVVVGDPTAINKKLKGARHVLKG